MLDGRHRPADGHAALEGISEGAARAGAGNAAIITNSSPFFVLVLERVFLSERASPIGVVGLVVGFAGIVVMVWSQLGDIADTGDFVLGVCLSFAGAMGWAVGVLMTKTTFTRQPDLDMLGLTAAQYVVGGAATLAIAFALEGGGTTEWSYGDFWAAIAWIAIGASAIATLTFFGALKRMSATTVTAWQFLVPVVAVITEIVYGNTPGAIVLRAWARDRRCRYRERSASAHGAAEREEALVDSSAPLTQLDHLLVASQLRRRADRAQPAGEAQRAVARAHARGDPGARGARRATPRSAQS